MQTQIMDGMRLQVAELRAQLERGLPGGDGGKPRATLLEELGEVKNAYETIFGTPQTTSGPSDMAKTIDDYIKLANFQLAQEEALAKMRRENLMLERKIGIEDKRVDEDSRRGKVLTDTLQAIIPQAQTVLEQAGQRFLGGNGAAQATPAAAVATGTVMPPGTKLTACPQCQQLVGFAPGYEVGVCPQCGTPLQYHENTAVPYQEPATASASNEDTPR
jgi:hypothetical protein